MKTRDYKDFDIVISSNGHGNEVYTQCPQCSRHRRKKNAKCLSVNLEKQCWICHHCDWRGTLKTGVEGQSEPFRWTARNYNKPVQQEAATLPEKVLVWFAERHIPEDILMRNKISYGPVWMPQVEESVNAIQFPFYRGEELLISNTVTVIKISAWLAALSELCLE